MQTYTSLLVTLPLLVLSLPMEVQHGIISQHEPIQIIHPRDHVDINISTSFSDTAVSNSHNNAKIETVNNVKNALVQIGDASNFTSQFRAFGNKNQIDSTGSNTGGHVAVNGTEWDNNSHKLARTLKRMVLFLSGSSKRAEIEKRDVVLGGLLAKRGVTLNILGRDVRGSNLTRSGNGNIVEIYLGEGSKDDVNITIKRLAEESNAVDSINENRVRVFTGYPGRLEGVEIRNSTVRVVKRLVPSSSGSSERTETNERDGAQDGLLPRGVEGFLKGALGIVWDVARDKLINAPTIEDWTGEKRLTSPPRR